MATMQSCDFSATSTTGTCFTSTASATAQINCFKRDIQKEEKLVCANNRTVFPSSRIDQVVGASTEAGAHFSGDEESLVKFPTKLLQVLENKQYRDAAWWNAEGDGVWIVPEAFTEKVLKQHFQGSKFPSFTRKLNRWGFKRVVDGSFPQQAVLYRHALFRRGEPHSIKKMRIIKKKEREWFEQKKWEERLGKKIDLPEIAAVSPQVCFSACLATPNQAALTCEVPALLANQSSLQFRQRESFTNFYNPVNDVVGAHTRSSLCQGSTLDDLKRGLSKPGLNCPDLMRLSPLSDAAFEAIQHFQAADPTYSPIMNQIDRSIVLDVAATRRLWQLQNNKEAVLSEASRRLLHFQEGYRAGVRQQYVGANFAVGDVSRILRSVP